MTEKDCTYCGQIKPLAMFSPCARGPMGRHWHCKACRSARQVVANKRKVTRSNAPPREEIWPRPLAEALLDLRARKWRYPVSGGLLLARVA